MALPPGPTRLPERRVAIWHDEGLAETFDSIAGKLRAQGIDVVHGPARFDAAVPTPPWLATVGAMLVSSRFRVEPALLDTATKLAGIVCASIGTENIDIDRATQRGVLIGHGATPENVISMAEATLLLILMLLYAPLASMQVMRNERERPRPSARWARTLSGKTVGLVGFGRIGRAVAQRLRAFDCRILVAAHARLDISVDLPGIEMASLDEVLRRSDVLSLHTTVRAGEPPVIDARALALMPPHACLVNTARGAAVDEAALARALASRRLAAAALDTFVVEPLPADSPLRRSEHVILTPHLVGHTREMANSFEEAALHNLLNLLEGRPPRHWKNPEGESAWRARWSSTSAISK